MAFFKNKQKDTEPTANNQPVPADGNHVDATQQQILETDDTVLMYDKDKKNVSVVAVVDGKVQNVELTPRSFAHFVRITNKGAWSNFVENFKSQFEDPSKVFFRVPVRNLDNVKQAFENLWTDRDAEKYLNNFKLLPDGRLEQVAKRYNFDVSEIPVSLMQKFGLPVEFWKKNGILDRMTRGDWSPVADYRYNDGLVDARGSAKVKFTRKGEEVGINIHGISRRPKFEDTIYKYKFTEEDIANFEETLNMGRLAPMEYPNGEKFNALCSYDEDTKMVHVRDAAKVYVPEKIYNHVITPDERQAILSGKAFIAEDCTDSDGREFGAKFQYNATQGRLARVYSRAFRQRIRERRDQIINYPIEEGQIEKGQSFAEVFAGMQNKDTQEQKQASDKEQKAVVTVPEIEPRKSTDMNHRIPFS